MSQLAPQPTHWIWSKVPLQNVSCNCSKYAFHDFRCWLRKFLEGTAPDALPAFWASTSSDNRCNLDLAFEIVSAMEGVPWSIVENVLDSQKANILREVRITEERKNIFGTVRKIAEEYHLLN